MAMVMAVCNSWNPLRSQNFFYANICYYFLVVIALHATALSFNLTNIGPQLNAEIVVEGDAYVSPEGIQLISNEINVTQNYSVGRATCKDPLFLWDNTFGKLTDFNTSFSFVIDSVGSYDFADGITFFLVPNGSTPYITVGGSIGLPIGPPTYVAISPFVVAEFDTYQDTWDPVDITPTTHVETEKLPCHQQQQQQPYSNKPIPAATNSNHHDTSKRHKANRQLKKTRTKIHAQPGQPPIQSSSLSISAPLNIAFQQNNHQDLQPSSQNHSRQPTSYIGPTAEPKLTDRYTLQQNQP
ncbi:hypothetical protein LOK49_LG12G00402 [Camellia lanceoleosa]|uniref:Uncharacterized protein n=1 Tax=Camellia lanceoleosa TaxID=1840588 RepID=A0ACC0FRX9_9ERIC|nr:hypothetical protein LOK49_LG12G00402 [Camellia lanceoleosa]